MPALRRPAVTLGCACALFALDATQRPAIRTLTATEEWAIDGKTQPIGGTAWILIAPDGRVIAAPAFTGGRIVAFDSLGRKPQWQLPVGHNRDLEIRFVNRIGWTGTQLWVSDRGYEQIALIDERGKVTKSLETPAFARPTLSDRKKYPVLTSMDPLARYADGSMLVRPVDKANVFETPEFDSTSTSLLRVSSGGIIQGVIATYPADPAVSFDVGGETHRRPIPMHPRTAWNVSPDGMRLVFISTALTGADSGTFRVVTLNERGDTVYAKRFPFSAMPVSQWQKDSALARVPAVRGVAIQQVRFALGPKMPKIFPPVLSAVIGRDHATWIALRAPAGDTSHTPWLVLDARGEPVGMTKLPRRTVVLAVDRNHAWGMLRAAQMNSTRALMRYRLNER
jgi:hypothetical protein